MERVTRELAAGEVLCALDRDELVRLAPLCRATAVSKGGVIFRPGDKAAVYLLAGGRVVVIAQPEVGAEVELFTRRRHQLFGEMSLFFTSTACAPGFDLCSGQCPCKMYATYNGVGASHDHVYRSTDSGVHWAGIGGFCDAQHLCPNNGACVNNVCPNGLPLVPANTLAISPTDPNTIFVATDMGLYSSTSTDGGATWPWCTFMNGLPQTVIVKDLIPHADSGFLRAFTYGRSAWETQAFTIPNPDRKVNTTNPVTDAQPPQISSRTAAGSGYAVTWADDRNGANNWHVQYRTFNPDGSPVGSQDVRVDDTSNHVAQAPAVADLAIYGTHGECSWVVWHDDRLDRTNHYNHVFYAYICGDGYKWLYDRQLDAQATNLNAIYPAVVMQPTNLYLASVGAWQADRTAVPNPLHDVYIRVFSGLGPATNPIQVNATSTTSDATFPALAADANNNTYVAWEEYEPGPNPPKEHKIFLSKYDVTLGLAHGPIRVDSQLNPSTTDRHWVSVAVDNQSGTNGPTIVVTWYEGTGGPEYVVRRRLQIPSSSSYIFLDDPPPPVDNPPLFPTGVQRALYPSAATDASNNFLIAWKGNVNGVDTGSTFGKSWDSSATLLKNDFRADLAGRAATTGAPHVARNSLAGKFAYAWRDNRSGHFDVYTRVVQSLP